MTKKLSKRIQVRDKDIDLCRSYPLDEALSLLKERSSSKFDETIEVVFSCNLDTRKGDQTIRSMVSLPQGTGKKVRVAVFAEGDQALKAQEAGAECVGGIDLIEEVVKGRMDFDLCIATPSMMPQLAKLGKILGPKGLMPNPKLGTVTQDVAAAVRSAKQGQASLRAEKAGIIHSIIGKASFSKEALSENFSTIYSHLLDLRPASVKGHLIKKVYVSSTMGFALALDLGKDLVLKAKA